MNDNFSYVSIEGYKYQTNYDTAYKHELKLIYDSDKIELHVMGLHNVKAIESLLNNRFTQGPNKRSWFWMTNGKNLYKLSIKRINSKTN